jgi:branched-subunit amino acid ABC-type transport system permease component
MHHWQDFVLTAGSLVFIAALLPSVFSNNKPAISTSAITGGVLGVFAVTYATLSLWFAAVTTAMSAVLWLFLAIQKLRTTQLH